MSSQNRSLRLALLSGVAVALVSAIGAGVAQAAPITYQLNTIISGNTLTPTASYGTVTYTDNGNSVDVTINLTGNNQYGASQFTMNYNDTKFPISGYTWSVSGDANTITPAENGIQADSYTTGKFDIALSNPDYNPFNNPDTFQGSEPYTFTISLKQGSTFYNLDPTDFAFATTGGLFNAVLIDCDPIWVGSRVAAVPEPASLALLGLGMAALGFTQRRKV